MGGGSLNSAAGGGDEALDGGGVETASELLLLRFDTGDDGDSEKIFVNATVEVENVANLLVGLRLG